jgi:hypothetical protein
MPTQWFRRTLASWLPSAGVATVLAFALYGGVQQVQRADANDPQLQMARDAAAALGAGASPSDVVGHGSVDVQRSLAPWMTVYDASGAPLASSGSDGGQPPLIPDRARTDAQRGELSFTWEPASGLRLATVVEPYAGGTVVAARSMQTVEQRESTTFSIAAIAWIGALLAAFVGSVAALWLRDRAPSAD